jgi:hypothetical protein
MIYTVDCPEGHRIVTTFPMIEATTLVEISEPNTWRRFTEKPGPNHQDALNKLRQAFPEGANALVGTRVATAAVQDGRGRLHLSITYIGTPVQLEPPPGTRLAAG